MTDYLAICERIEAQRRTALSAVPARDPAVADLAETGRAACGVGDEGSQAKAETAEFFRQRHLKSQPVSRPQWHRLRQMGLPCPENAWKAEQILARHKAAAGQEDERR